MNEEAESPEVEEEYLDDPVLCVHCTKTIPWDANLCVHCKAPQNFIASTDPYQRIHAEGFILRTAAENPRSWLTLIGIWLIYLPTLFTLCFFATSTATLAGAAGLEMIVLLAWGLLSLGLIARTTWNFVRLRREGRGQVDEG